MTAKSKAVVTGGAGFIGSHMTDLLVAQDIEVRIIDDLSGGNLDNIGHHKNNSLVKFEQADIRDISPSAEIFGDVDYLFHFAGIGDIVPSIEKPQEYMSVNVQGTTNILEAARQNKVKKMVYAASSSCYGLASVPTDENHFIETKYPYALSKYQGEQAALHWHQVYGLPVNSIRIFNAYGTRSRTTGAYGAVFGVFLRQLLENKPLTIVGDGTQSRDFLYVTDVARAFLAASQTSISGEIFNLGAGNPQSVNRLVELLHSDIIHIPKRPGEPDCTWADITKITRELDWEPLVSFEEGVGNILKNIDYWKNAPLWDQDSIAEATETWFKFMQD